MRCSCFAVACRCAAERELREPLRETRPREGRAPSLRVARVGAAIVDHVSGWLASHAADRDTRLAPGGQALAITRAELPRDLRRARVYWALPFMPGDERAGAGAAASRGAPRGAGFTPWEEEGGFKPSDACVRRRARRAPRMAA